MGKITVLSTTTKNPISLIGERAGICWGADISDQQKNYKRGLDCIHANHGRTLEFPNIELIIDGYSARVIREWFTHIGCLPSRLQESTRYIDYKDFKYITPSTISKNEKALKVYDDIMKTISEGMQTLEELNIPREDSAMALPLSMATKIVDKRNLRNYIDMSRQRKCSRANWEFRQLFNDICTALSSVSDEWKYIVETEFMPKCEVLGYCPEKHSCGRKSKKQRQNAQNVKEYTVAELIELGEKNNHLELVEVTKDDVNG